MDRPTWMRRSAWHRLAPVLAAQRGHAADALEDLQAVTASWDAAHRDWLVDRVADHAADGTPLPAALVLALCEVLDD